VLVDLGDGRFEPRDVELGARGDDFVAILKGVKEGETVVVAANFLIDSESNLKAALSGLTPAPASAPAPAAGSKVHTAVGSIDAIDAKDGTLLISHDAIASLKWPKMTMEFKPSNDAIVAAAKAAKTMQPGVKVPFEFVERKPGEWVVTKIDAGK
jgi:Cu(I)/Ag(I) efflux system membrane fusion protein